MKLAKRTLVLLLTLTMLLGCIPAFSATAKDAVVEGIGTSTSVITSYEQIYVKNGLVLLSTMYGNEGDGNVTLSTTESETGMWNNRVGDDNIVIVGRSKAATGNYNGWWIGENGKGMGYNLYNLSDWSGKYRKYGMRLPLSLLGEKDIAVEYVFDYIGFAETTGTNNKGFTEKDYLNGSFTFQGLFLTLYQPSVGAPDGYGKSGMDMVFHYSNSGVERDTIGCGSPLAGGVSGIITEKLLSPADDPATDVNESLIGARDGVFTMTINRDYASGGPNLIDGKNNYAYAGYNVYLNGTSRVFLDNHLQHNDETNYGAEKNGKLHDAKYYTVADITDKSNSINTADYSAFDAFFGFPAQVFAVRVYDRQLSEAEQAQNHFADIVGWFGNAAIDLAAYSKLSSMARANVHEELVNVSFTLTTADAVNAVIAKWAAKEIATSAYDRLYVKDGLVLLTSAFGGDASVDLANGVWYNKAKNGVTNVKINGTWNALENGGIGYAGNVNSSKGNYLSFSGVVSTLGDYTVEYFAKLDGRPGDKANQKLGDWGDWYYNNGAIRQLYSHANIYTSYMHGYGYLQAKDYALNTAAASVAHVIDNESVADNSFRTQYVNAEIPNKVLNHLDINGRQGTKGDTIRKNYQENPEFWIARNKNAEVYAIRVYDRALSAAEVKYNAAVDKAAYYGLDVSALALFSATVLQKTSFVNLATYGDNLSDTSALEAIVATAVTEAAMLTYDQTYSPLAEGYQISLDGDALRLWASAATFENVSGLGMMITFKQNGNVVYSGKGETKTAFSAIVAEGNTISASSLGVAGFYAASVTGFAPGTYTVEVMPYVILMDGTAVVGAPYSFETWFEF